MQIVIFGTPRHMRSAGRGAAQIRDIWPNPIRTSFCQHSFRRPYGKTLSFTRRDEMPRKRHSARKPSLRPPSGFAKMDNVRALKRNDRLGLAWMHCLHSPLGALPALVLRCTTGIHSSLDALLAFVCWSTASYTTPAAKLTRDTRMVTATAAE